MCRNRATIRQRHDLAVLAMPNVVAFELGLPHRLLGGAVGTFVLAAAGLLGCRPATTHWLHTAAFRRLFPAVRLDPDVLYVDDGDVLTSAGNAAGTDLCLHLVRRDHGPAVANRVARCGVVAPCREGGQLPVERIAAEDRFRHHRLAAPAPARGHRGGPAGLPAQLPRGGGAGLTGSVPHHIPGGGRWARRLEDWRP